MFAIIVFYTVAHNHTHSSGVKPLSRNSKLYSQELLPSRYSHIDMLLRNQFFNHHSEPRSNVISARFTYHDYAVFWNDDELEVLQFSPFQGLNTSLYQRLSYKLIRVFFAINSLSCQWTGDSRNVGVNENRLAK